MDIYIYIYAFRYCVRLKGSKVPEKLPCYECRVHMVPKENNDRSLFSGICIVALQSQWNSCLAQLHLRGRG